MWLRRNKRKSRDSHPSLDLCFKWKHDQFTVHKPTFCRRPNSSTLLRKRLRSFQSECFKYNRKSSKRHHSPCRDPKFATKHHICRNSQQSECPRTRNHLRWVCNFQFEFGKHSWSCRYRAVSDSRCTTKHHVCRNPDKSDCPRSRNHFEWICNFQFEFIKCHRDGWNSSNSHKRSPAKHNIRRTTYVTVRRRNSKCKRIYREWVCSVQLECIKCHRYSRNSPNSHKHSPTKHHICRDSDRTQRPRTCNHLKRICNFQFECIKRHRYSWYSPNSHDCCSAKHNICRNSYRLECPRACDHLQWICNFQLERLERHRDGQNSPISHDRCSAKHNQCRNTYRRECPRACDHLQWICNFQFKCLKRVWDSRNSPNSHKRSPAKHHIRRTTHIPVCRRNSRLERLYREWVCSVQPERSERRWYSRNSPNSHKCRTTKHNQCRNFIKSECDWKLECRSLFRKWIWNFKCKFIKSFWNSPLEFISTLSRHFRIIWIQLECLTDLYRRVRSNHKCTKCGNYIIPVDIEQCKCRLCKRSIDRNPVQPTKWFHLVCRRKCNHHQRNHEWVFNFKFKFIKLIWNNFSRKFTKLRCDPGSIRVEHLWPISSQCVSRNSRYIRSSHKCKQSIHQCLPVDHRRTEHRFSKHSLYRNTFCTTGQLCFICCR